jgi:large repetitive protein
VLRSLLAFSFLSLVAPFALAQSSDVAVSKTGPAQAFPDTDIEYDVTVTNVGTTTASPVTLTDPIPAGMTFVSAISSPGFSCTTPAVGSGGTVTCTATSLGTNSSVTLELVVHIDANSPPGSSFTNVATVSTPGDNNSNNDSSTVVTTLFPKSDLQVSKSGPSTASPDTDVTYVVTVTNFGPEDAEDVSLNDPIPAGMTFVSANSGAIFTCSTPDPGEPGTISCNADLLPAGSSTQLTFVLHIDGEAEPGTSFTNIATASTESDLATENNSGIAVTTIPQPPTGDVAVTKNGPGAAGPDTDVVYTIVVSNGGPSAAENVALNDTLPGTMTFVSLQQSSNDLACATPAVGAGGTITCTAASLAAGATVTLTLTGHVPAGTVSGTEYTNEATVAATNDPNEENDVAATSLIVSSTDPAIVKTGPATVTAGSNVTYTITVTNQGPNTAMDATFTDPLPPNTTFVSVTQNSGPAAACDLIANTLICGTPALGSGLAMEFSLVLTAGNTPSITNTAETGTSSYDSDPSNNESTAVTTVTPVADLSVTKTAPPSAVAGQNILFTITVTNGGPSTATNVSVSDVLPPGTTFVSVMQISGPPFACGNVAGTVTCTIAAFAPFVPASIVIVANVSPAATGTIANTVTVGSTTPDPALGNNTFTTLSVPVGTSADLAVVKNAPGGAVSLTDVTFTVSAMNIGPSNAVNVTLTDVLPANATFVSATQTSGPPFTCGQAAGTITCTIATLVSGEIANFDFVVTVTGEGPLANTATIGSTTPDPVTANNTSTSTTNVSAAPADLSIVKTANAPQPVPGAPATFTIVVTNNGPGPADDVVVTDPLPAGVTLISATSTQGTCTGTTTVVCTVGTLLATASATITLDVRLPLTPGPVSNTATVTSSDADLSPANNTSSATIASGNPANIPTLSTYMLALLALGMVVLAMTKL